MLIHTVPYTDFGSTRNTAATLFPVLSTSWARGRFHRSVRWVRPPAAICRSKKCIVNSSVVCRATVCITFFESANLFGVLACDHVPSTATGVVEPRAYIV